MPHRFLYLLILLCAFCRELGTKLHLPTTSAFWPTVGNMCYEYMDPTVGSPSERSEIVVLLLQHAAIHRQIMRCGSWAFVLGFIQPFHLDVIWIFIVHLVKA